MQLLRNSVDYIYIYIYNIKWSRNRTGLAQRVGRGIALVFHDRSTRRAWVVSSTPRPHFTPGKYPVPILQEAGWYPGPVWTGGISRPHRDSIPGRPPLSQSLYRLSYPAHTHTHTHIYRYRNNLKYSVSSFYFDSEAIPTRCKTRTFITIFTTPGHQLIS